MSTRWLKECPCGSGLEAQVEFDGYAIPLGYMCDKCRPEKMRGFRPDINERYECDEPIEPEEY